MIKDSLIIIGVSFVCFSLLSIIFLNNSREVISYKDSTIKKQQMYIDNLSTNNNLLKHAIDIERQYTNRETTWLTRLLISETNKISEMKYVANVVRNRVDVCYRGKCTYEDVILHSRQFSAFNRNSRFRNYYYNLNGNHPLWDEAYNIAEDVITSNRSDLPLPIYVTHFFSQVSMKGHTYPYWAYNMNEYETELNSWRFRFYYN